MFKNESRFSVRSAGLSPKSSRKISENDLNWADLVLVMEPDHRAKIKKLYSFLELPKIEILHIPDEYEFMDEDLVALLSDKISERVSHEFGI